MSWILAGLAAWLVGWWSNVMLARLPKSRATGLAVPVIFGLTIIVMWECFVRGLDVSSVILPPPTAIAARFAESTAILWEDFVQTVIKGALTGYVLGCGAAFLTAIAVDRFPFLQRGLLPVGNFVAALPIIGMAPILVMWFGFDWQSKAAVVVVMVFFPMLVNTVQGLQASDRMQRDLMRTYASSYWQTLFKLRLPAAMPFIFNGLKIATTLALIGAIVAEFFVGNGTNYDGLGTLMTGWTALVKTDALVSAVFASALLGVLMFGSVHLISAFLLKRWTQFANVSG